MENHNFRQVETEFRLAMVDLGAVLVSLAAVERTGLRFSKALPRVAIAMSHLSEREQTVSLMRAHHDNDWWFVHDAIVELGLESAVVPQVLFNHN